jgi:RNA polymerase sigma factor (sigma-70 family)
MKPAQDVRAALVNIVEAEDKITVGDSYGEQSLNNANVPDDVEALYLEHRNLLLYLGCRKFRIPENDAEGLIQEVFLSLLQTGQRRAIDNVRAWLVAAMCNASRHYWRSQGRTESLPDDFAQYADPASLNIADQLATRMMVERVLDYLQPQCRETLKLYYLEGRSPADVARELETTTRYAEKLIHNCLRRVREIYKSIVVVEHQAVTSPDAGSHAFDNFKEAIKPGGGDHS